jgi:hypothetical protein
MTKISMVLLIRTSKVGARTIPAAACVGHHGQNGYMDDSKVVEPGSVMSERYTIMSQAKSYDQILVDPENQVPGVSKNDPEYDFRPASMCPEKSLPHVLQS